jgi:hypothetical protein
VIAAALLLFRASAESHFLTGKSKGALPPEKHYGGWQRYSMLDEGVAVRFSVTVPDP